MAGEGDLAGSWPSGCARVRGVPGVEMAVYDGLTGDTTSGTCSPPNEKRNAADAWGAGSQKALSVSSAQGLRFAYPHSPRAQRLRAPRLARANGGQDRAFNERQNEPSPSEQSGRGCLRWWGKAAESHVIAACALNETSA